MFPTGIDHTDDSCAGDEQFVSSQSDSDESQQAGAHGLTEEEEVGQETNQLDDSTRMLHVSKIFAKVDPDLVRALGPAICKMLRFTVSNAIRRNGGVHHSQICERARASHFLDT